MKERRIAKKWSIQKLSIKSGVSCAEVYFIESEKRKEPSIIILNSLAKTLGILQDDILIAAGYKLKGDNDDLLFIERAFPNLKTQKQYQTVQKFADILTTENELEDVNYDELIVLLESFLKCKEKMKPVVKNKRV